ncbi:hypothetical protein D3C76_1346740 [compost metagenome]
MHLAHMPGQRQGALPGGGAPFQVGQAEQVGHLAEHDNQRRAQGEAEHHRLGHEVGQGAEAQ